MVGTDRHDFLLGVNYWPAEHGVHWWEEFNPEQVARDMAAMQRMGLNTVRIFLRWQDFQPEPDRVSDKSLAAFEQVLALARRHGLQLIPTLFTGHMSGENWDVSWRRRRCPYSDPDLLRAQLYFVHHLACRYGREKSIIAWDLANEHDNFAPLPSSSAGYLWAHLLTREFQLFARQPVILGTHVTSFTERHTFRFPDLGGIHPEICVHPYPLYSKLCPGRPSLPPSTFFPSFCLKLARALGGKPVLLEEFGVTTTMIDEAEARRYFQVALFSTLAAGSTGALAWCFADFLATHRLPYATVPYEIGFGLTKEGSLKGPGEAMAAFTALMKGFPWKRLGPAPARAAIMVPARYYDHPEEGFSPAYIFGTLFAAYVLAKQAGIDVDFITPGSPLDGYRLVICPSVPRRGSLDLPHWEELSAFVRQGGCLYLSYAGAALPGFEEVFGFRRLYPDVATWPAMPGENGPRLRLLVEPDKALILQEAADGRPLALGHGYGCGYALFVTEPVEAGLATAPHHLANGPFYKLYRQAAVAAGLDPGAWGVTETAFGPSRPASENREAAPAPPRDHALLPGHAAGPRTPGEAKLFLPQEESGREPPYLVLASHSDQEATWPNPERHTWEDVATGEIFPGPVPLSGHQGRLLRLLS